MSSCLPASVSASSSRTRDCSISTSSLFCSTSQTKHAGGISVRHMPAL
jgi:hypothetical protein